MGWNGILKCEYTKGVLKMFKRVLSLLAALLLLILPLSVAGADGEASYWDASYQAMRYDEPHYGIVICRQMNVRNKASTSGNTYGQIKNGQPVKILGISSDGNFYVLDLQSCGFAGAAPGSFGFAKSSLIRMDPTFFYAYSMTDLYATPWGDGKKNGEQGNRYFLVISRNDSWYAVQTMDTTPGTSFVRAGSVRMSYQSKYLVTWDAPLYEDEYTTAPFRTVSRYGLTGRLINMRGDRTMLLFNEGTAEEFSAWIPSLYIAPVIN